MRREKMSVAPSVKAFLFWGLAQRCPSGGPVANSTNTKTAD